MDPFRFSQAGSTLTVEGEITDDCAARFRDALVAAGQPTPTLDLLDLDLEDGVAVAESVNAVRLLLAHHGGLTLRFAPQMLAHTLYKIGMLRSGQLVLESPRVESPTVA